MYLATFYTYVRNMERSVDFYRNLLSEEPQFHSGDRWVQFSNHIALYNKEYDRPLIERDNGDVFNKAYIDEFYRDTDERKNNAVVFNFYTEDLLKEYERLKALNIGPVSELMYVNVFCPYWYFNITDPDGNVIEITGNYDG